MLIAVFLELKWQKVVVSIVLVDIMSGWGVNLMLR